jgi:ATP-dependent Clp endopeptidase proteolytic subunit ClpP
MTAADRPRDPAVVAAEIDNLNAEASYFKAQATLIAAQTRKEDYISKQHEFAADEARRLHDTIQHSNDQNRVYDYIGPINTNTTETCMGTLSRWKRQSKESITIRVSSPGGSVIDGLALYDFIEGIKASGITVRVVVLGIAASMAGVLLQSASEGCRVVGPNARFLIHEISGGSIGKLSDIEDETKMYKNLNDQLYDLLAKRSKMTRREIELKAKRKDWWMNSKECIVSGFCDIIGYD